MKLWRNKLFILIVVLPVCAQSQQLPTKHEQYEFLKWYLAYKKFESLSDTTIVFDSTLSTKYSMGGGVMLSLKLSPANINYIKKQNTHNTRTILDTNYLSHVKWQSKGTYHYISAPIFSTNKRIVLIRSGYYCGFSCGENGMEVFIKKKTGTRRLSRVPLPIEVY